MSLLGGKFRIQLSSTRRRLVVATAAHAASTSAQKATRRGVAQLVRKRSADAAGFPPRVAVESPVQRTFGLMIASSAGSSENVNSVEKTIAAAPNMPKTRSGLRLTAAIESSPTTVEIAVVMMGRVLLLNAATIVSSVD